VALRATFFLDTDFLGADFAALRAAFPGVAAFFFGADFLTPLLALFFGAVARAGLVAGAAFALGAGAAAAGFADVGVTFAGGAAFRVGTAFGWLTARASSCTAKEPPCGSTTTAIQLPPGTSIGPFTTRPPADFAAAAARAQSLTCT
jgi:hypothetical protein